MADEPLKIPNAVVCSVCNGDPRRSVGCKACGGAGVGVPSPEGFLVWEDPVDELAAAIRRARMQVDAVFHLLLMIAGGLGLVSFAWYAVHLQYLTQLLSLSTWLAPNPFLSLFYFSLFLDCFLIFRLWEFSSPARVIASFSKTDAEIKQASAHTSSYRFNVSPFFAPSAREVIERAYDLSKSLGLTEVSPASLFAAVLASPAGSVCLIRLGLSFDRVKTPMARVLMNEANGKPPVHLSLDAKRVLATAYAEAAAKRRKYVSVYDVFAVAFKASPPVMDMLDQLGFPPEHVERVGEWIGLGEALREDHERFVHLAALKPSSIMNRSMTARPTPLLDRYSEDLTRAARSGYLAHAIGRDDVMQEMFRALESGSRSLALVGETGVGKGALVEELARRMVEETVPDVLFDRRLVAVNVAQLISSGGSALAADRLLSVMQEAGVSGNIVLVLNGIESLSGSGSAGGPLDLLEVLAGELEKGYVRVIATTTPDAWTRYIERRTLASKLVKVEVHEITDDDALRVLMVKSLQIEYQNKVFFSYAALDKAAALASRYLTDKAMPDAAIDVMQEAATLAHGRGDHTFVTADDVAKIVHERTNIPVEAVTANEKDKLLNLEASLHKRVIGQDEAVQAAAQALKRARAELREGKRPIANFLFLGPTGVGKTELAKALAAEYFGSEDAMIRLDMSEYQQPSALARLIGAPGDERGGLLTEAVRRRPFSLVLLDELEKAHPDLLTIFLQVMDDGRLTDGIGRTVDFTNVLLIATSNAGTQYIQDAVKAGTSTDIIRTNLLENELKGIFRPEFLNRFDGVIVFKPLTMDDVTQIAWLMVNGIAARLKDKGIEFHAEDEAVEELARAGFDPIYGARPLRRVIQERVDNALADALLKGTLGRKDTVILKPGGTIEVRPAPRI